MGAAGDRLGLKGGRGAPGYGGSWARIWIDGGRRFFRQNFCFPFGLLTAILEAGDYSPPEALAHRCAVAGILFHRGASGAPGGVNLASGWLDPDAGLVDFHGGAVDGDAEISGGPAGLRCA